MQPLQLFGTTTGPVGVPTSGEMQQVLTKEGLNKSTDSAAVRY